MKKYLLILAAICMTMAANAKILRVSNVSGSSAPYTTIEDAHNDASAGDTIMVDASVTRYGKSYDIALTKRVVLIGPGYWLVQNKLVEEGAGYAYVSGLVIKAVGTVVKGMTLGSIGIQAKNVVVNRCNIGNVFIKSGCDNAIISQCFISGEVNGDESNYHMITNNLFTTTQPYLDIVGVNNSYIAYNTCRANKFEFNTSNCTIENNLLMEIGNGGTGNSFNNNYLTDIINTQATDDFIDSDYFNLEIPSEVLSLYGAFAGESPYVISGIPTGPYIIGIDVPSTVEEGSTTTVTIKVNISK